MSIYSIALFVHIVGAVLVFVLLTVEAIGMRSGAAGGAVQLGRTLGPVAAVAIVVPGFYMAAQTGWYAWTASGLAAYAVIAGLGAYTGVAAMRGRITKTGAMLSWLVRAGLAVGVLFDMTVKPGAAVSVAAVLLGAAALGIGGLTAGRRALYSSD